MIYAVVISAAIISASTVVIVESGSPFDQNIWGSSLTGNLGDSAASNSTFFVVNYVQKNKSIDNSMLYEYTVDAFNITQGTELWTSSSIEYYGITQFETSNFFGPRIWYCSNIVYLLGYNFL